MGGMARRGMAAVRLASAMVRTAVVEGLEGRRLLSAAFDLTGLTRLRNDPVYASVDGSGITVAVLDTGVFGGHPDLVGNFRGYVDMVVSPARSAVLVTNPGGSLDPDGHGTHVAGTIASTNRGIGVAHAASFIAIRALPADGERLRQHDPLLEGLRWVLANHREQGIRVVNMSLGFPGVNQNTPTNSETMRVIRSLESVGVTVVSANGNNYSSFQTAGASSPAVDSTIGVVNTWEDSGVGDSFPSLGGAGGFRFLAVDAAPRADQIAASSQRSSMANQVAAPGSTIFSTWNGAGGQLYNTIAGTSMASPFVAGVVALMQDAAQTFGGSFLRPEQVLTILRETGDVIVDSNVTTNAALDSQTEQLFDLPETGLSFSRVNVYRAVERVRSLFVTAAGDADRTLATAFNVPPIAPGRGWVMGQRSIGADGTLGVGNRDVDLYKVELTASGILEFELKPVGGQAQGRFAVRFFGSDGADLGVVTAPSGYPSETTVLLPKGTYYLGVSGEGNVNYNPTTGAGTVASFTGGYALTVRSDSPDPDGGLLAATEVELLAITDVTDDFRGFVTLSGNIGSDVTEMGSKFVGTADVDVYGFVAPDSGFVDIDLVADGSNLDGYLRVFNEQGEQIAMDDDSGGNGNASIRLSVVKGQIYLVGVSSFEGRGFDPLTPSGGSAGAGATFGNYLLFLQFSNRDADGTALMPRVVGLGSFGGAIGNDGGVLVGADGRRDVDFFLVEATGSGLMRFEMLGGFESVMSVSIYDSAAGELLELGRSTGTNHQLQILTGAGEFYWVSVTGRGNEDFNWYVVGSGSGGATGNYTFRTSLLAGSTATPRDDSLATARGVTVGRDLAGTIGRDGTLLRRDPLNDVDVYRYVATTTGMATVTVVGSGDLKPDVYLRVFDGNGVEVGFNDDAAEGTTDARLTFAVVSGQTYYLGVSGFGETPRAYSIVTGAGAAGGLELGDYVLRVSEVGMPTVSVSDAAANEGSPLVFTVSLSGAYSLPVTVTFSTVNGSAVSGVHFGGGVLEVTVPAGQTQQTVTVSTVADGVVGGNLTFSATLTGVVNGTLGRATGLGTIVNTDEPAPGPDLTASIYFAPERVVPGAKRNPVGVAVSNVGELAVRGSVRVDVFASADGTFDGGDLLLGSSVVRLNLRAGVTRFSVLNFASPVSVAEGSYVLMAVLDAGGAVVEKDEGNNLAVSEGSTFFVAPFVDLSVSVVGVPATIRPGARSFATVRVTNGGNVTASGSATTELLLGGTVGGEEFGVFGRLSRGLKVGAGRSVTLRVPLLRPAEAGTVFASALLTWAGATPDRELANNRAFSDRAIVLL